MDGVQRVLAELDVAAERPLKQRLRRLGHQQRPVTRPPDDGHRVHDLPLRTHRPVVSRRTAAGPGPQKAARVTQAMLSMTKLDIAVLEKAYAGV